MTKKKELKEIKDQAERDHYTLQKSIDNLHRYIDDKYDNLQRKCDGLDRRINALQVNYKKFGDEYAQLKYHYYLQRAQELGYDKRITFKRDSEVFLIDDSETEYTIHSRASGIDRFYADGAEVILPPSELALLVNIIGALRYSASESFLPSLENLFNKKETKK